MSLAITSISPLAAVRGNVDTGTVISIAGTGFGAEEGTSTVTIGGVAALIHGWGDTGINVVASASPATPLGAQDIVVTVGGVAVTASKGVYVYDSTDAYDATEIKFGLPTGVYIDGLHIGKTVGPVNIAHSRRTVPYQPSDVRGGPLFERIVEVTASVSFTASQINGTNVALATGGSYNSTSGVVTLSNPAGTNVAEHSVYVVDEHGVGYMFPRCRMNDLSPINLGAEDWQGLSFSFTAYQVNQTDTDVCRYKYAAAS